MADTPHDGPSPPESAHERQPASAATKRLLRYFYERVRAEQEELLGEAAQSEGYDRRDGWQFDVQEQEWVRPIPPTPEREEHTEVHDGAHLTG